MYIMSNLRSDLRKALRRPLLSVSPFNAPSADLVVALAAMS